FRSLAVEKRDSRLCRGHRIDSEDRRVDLHTRRDTQHGSISTNTLQHISGGSVSAAKNDQICSFPSHETRDPHRIVGGSCFSNPPNQFSLKFQLVCNVISHASGRNQELDSLVSTLYLFQVSQAPFWRHWFRALSHRL